MLGLSAGQDWLSIVSNAAQAITGIVAGLAGLRFVCQRYERRVRLEKYLTDARKEAELPGGEGAGVKSTVHLMGNCLLTEAQVFEAAFASDKIRTWMTVGGDGYAGKLMFQLTDEAWREVQRSNKI